VIPQGLALDVEQVLVANVASGGLGRELSPRPGHHREGGRCPLV
jgi:hypothetical protein